MEMTPKCTSWLGHKFEGRYSEGPSRFKAESAEGMGIKQIAETYREVTYERDICIRCGATVEKVK